jgi:methionine synthase II (cobalamin-independent)
VQSGSLGEAIFNQTGVYVHLMEYDTERAGGLETWRLLPKGNKRVLPGFTTTKRGELETLDDLQRRFDEASKYVDIGPLGIAPQCGLAYNGRRQCGECEGDTAWQPRSRCLQRERIAGGARR